MIRNECVSGWKFDFDLFGATETVKNTIKIYNDKLDADHYSTLLIKKTNLKIYLRWPPDFIFIPGE